MYGGTGQSGLFIIKRYDVKSTYLAHMPFKSFTPKRSVFIRTIIQTTVTCFRSTALCGGLGEIKLEGIK